MFSVGSAGPRTRIRNFWAFRCCGSKTCKNTCKCCTGATWRSKWPAPACSGAASALEGAVRACFCPSGALKMALWPAPEPPVRSERLRSSLLGRRQCEQNGRSGMLRFWSVCSKRLSVPASVPPVRSKRLFERAVRDRCSQKLVSVAACSEPMHSARLCCVHGYARVHTSIYIYIYIYIEQS